MIYQRFDTLQLKCLSCKSANHFIAQCPLLNYIPNKELVLHKYKISEPQKRKDFTRKFHKINCRQNYHFNQIKAFEFKTNRLDEMSKEGSSSVPDEDESKFSQSLENIDEKSHSNVSSPQIKKTKKSQILSNPASPGVLIPNEQKFKNLRIQIEKKEGMQKGKMDEGPAFPSNKSAELLAEKTPSLKANDVNNKKKESSNIIEQKSGLQSKIFHKKESNVEDHKSMVLNEQNLELFSKVMNFEIAKNYKFYYPHNNVAHVIKYLQRRKSKKKLSARKSLNSNKNFLSALFSKSSFHSKTNLHSSNLHSSRNHLEISMSRVSPSKCDSNEPNLNLLVKNNEDKENINGIKISYE